MSKNIKGYWLGFLINLQFFSSFPIRRELPLDTFYLTYAIRTFPLIGLLQGGIYVVILFLLSSFTPFSDLVITLILWLILIILSGGIHVDGWIDVSDAYFSYRDVDKRLEIMKDPRVGAFGVISIVIFLVVRFIFIYEIVLLTSSWTTYFFIAAIPMLGKSVMGIYLQTLPAARNRGMATFFQQGRQKYLLSYYSVYLLIFGFFLTFVQMYLIIPYALMIVVTWFVSHFAAKKIIKNFRGITGDILGASSEGVELILWITVWLLHSFAMV